MYRMRITVYKDPHGKTLKGPTAVHFLGDLCSGLGLFGVIFLISQWRFRKMKKQWEVNSAQLEQQREAAVAEYTPLYEAEAEARAAWEAVSASASANLDSILTQLRSFRPMVRNLPEACQALNDAFLLRGKLEQAQRREDEARHRWEALRDAAPPIPSVPAQRPEASREDLRFRLAQLREQEASIHRELHTTQGRIQSLGDPSELRLGLQALEELSKAGIFSGVLLMPVLPYVEDSAENVLSVVDSAARAGARFVYAAFGVTMRDGQRDYFLNGLDRAFPGMGERYRKRYGSRYYCSSPKAKELWELFKDSVTEGMTIAAPGFYAPQGRWVRLEPQDAKLNEKIESFDYEGRRITNFEMEGSALAGLAALMGHRATTICTIIAQRIALDACTDYKPFVRGMIEMALDKLATLE